MRGAAIASAVGVVGLVVLAGCGDDDDTGTGTARSEVTVDLADGELSVPARFAGGVVDVVLDAAEGEQSHHVVFARLGDDVTYEQFEAAGDDEFFGLVTMHGGNGSLEPGEQVRLTLDLPPGDYQVLDLPDGELAAAARTTVTEPDDDAAAGGAAAAAAPDARGTVGLGPGFAFDLPEDFDGTGTWAFANEDDEAPHEAVLMALDPGASVDDVVEWATTFAGPPPGQLIGGFGTLSAGERGWLDLGDDLPEGDYALVCLLPGPDGTTHAASGMVTSIATTTP